MWKCLNLPQLVSRLTVLYTTIFCLQDAGYSLTSAANLLAFRSLNSLTPRSDSHVTSPYNIHPLSSKQVMRILKCIR